MAYNEDINFDEMGQALTTMENQTENPSALRNLIASAITQEGVAGGPTGILQRTFVSPIDKTVMYGKALAGASPEELNRDAEQLAVMSGLTPSGRLDEGNAIEQIAGVVAPAAAGSGLFRGGLAVTNKVLEKMVGRGISKEVSKLVAKESFAKTALKEGGDIIAQGVTTTPMDLVNVEYGDEGVQAQAATDAGSFMKGLTMNTLMDATMTGTGFAGARGISKAKEAYSANKRFTPDKTVAHAAIDSEALAAINQETLGQVGMATDPSGFVDISEFNDVAGGRKPVQGGAANKKAMAQEVKGLQDELTAQRQEIAGLPPAEQAAAEMEIRTNGIVKYSEIVGKYGTEEQRTKARKKLIDTYNEKSQAGELTDAQEQNFKTAMEALVQEPTKVTPEPREGFEDMTLDQLSNDNRFKGAVRDGNEFLIKTDTMGTLRGEIVDGRLKVDLQKSSPGALAKTGKYNGVNILTPMKDADYLKAMNMFKSPEPGKVSRFHEFAYTGIDESGNLVYDEKGLSKVAEKLDMSVEDLKSQIESNNKISGIVQAGVQGQPRLGSEGTVTSTPRITSDVLMAETIQNPSALPEDLRTLREFVENFRNQTGTSMQHGMTGKEITLGPDASKTEKDLMDLLFNKEEVPSPTNEKVSSTRYTSPKKEFKAALDTAYALNVAKLDIGNPVRPSDLAKQTIDTAFELLGIKDKNSVNNIELEAARNKLKDLFANDITPPETGNGYFSIDENGNIVRTKAIDKGVEQDLATLGSDVIERQTSIENVLKYGVRPEKDGTRFTEDLSSDGIRDLYGAPQSVKDAAKKQGQTPFVYNKDALNLAGELIKKGDIEIGRVIAPELRGKSVNEAKAFMKAASPNLVDSINKAIEGFKEEHQRLESLHAMSNGRDTYFNTEIDITGRIRYTGMVNPQNSKLARMVLRNKDGGVALYNPDGGMNLRNIEYGKRAFLQHFGEKPEKIKDGKILDEKFQNLVDTLLVKKKGNDKYTVKPLAHMTDEGRKLMVDDGIISFLSLQEFADFASVLSNGTTDKIAIPIEVDGIANGIALNYANLGIIDARYGIGSEVPTSGTSDVYEIVSNLVNEGFGLTGDAKISRKEAKSIVFPSTNMASDYAVTKILAETILRKSWAELDTAKRLDLFGDEFINYFEHLMDKKNVAENIANTNTMVKKFNDLDQIIKKALNNGSITEVSPDALRNLDIQQKELSKMRDRIVNTMESQGNDYHSYETIKNAYLGFLELLNNERMSDSHIDAIGNIYSAVYEGKLHEVLNSSDVYHERLNAYRDTLGEVTKFAQVAFGTKYTAKVLNEDAAYAFIDDIFKNLDKKYSKETIEGTKRRLFKSKNGKYSREDVVNFMAKEGYVNESILKTKQIDSIMPKMDTPYGQVPMMTTKGFAGYDRGTKLNFRSVTPIQVFQPVLTISMDASIMARSLNDKMVNIFDAGFGSVDSMIDFGSSANTLTMQMLLHGNGAKDLKISLDRMMDQFEHNNLQEGLEWAAKQNLMSRGRNINSKAVNDTISKIEKYIPNAQNVIAMTGENSRLKSLIGDIDGDKASFKNDFDLVVEQYTNGAKDMAIKNNGTIRPADFESATTDTQLTHQYDLDYFTNIKPAEGGLVEFMDFTADTPKGITDQANVIFSEDLDASSFDKDNNTIYIKGTDKPSVEIMREVVHETAHKEFSAKPEAYRDLLEHLNTMIGDGLVLKDGGTFANIDITKDLNDENIAQLFHALYTNELLMSNPKEMAKAFGKTEFKTDINTYSMEYKGQTINSLNQFIDLLPDDALKSQARDLKVRVNAQLNSNVNIKGWANGFESKPFSTTLKKTIDNVKVGRVDIAKLNEKISTIPLFELMSVNPQKEALLTMINMKDGAEKRIQSMTADFGEQLINTIHKVGNRELDRDIGTLVLTGASKFMNELENARTSKDYMVAIEKNVDAVSKQWEAIAAEKGQHGAYKALLKDIKNLTDYGKSTKRTIAKKFADKIYGTNREAMMKDMDAVVDFVEKQAAVMLARKYESSIGRVFGTFTTHASEVREMDARSVAMDVLRLNDRYRDTESLFGENPEYNLRQNGKRGVLVPDDTKVKGSDILGKTIVDGEIYKIVTKDDPNYYVGKQEKEIMEIDPDNLEKGIYSVKTKGRGPKKYVFLKPQAISRKSRYVDTSASTMMRRNFYNKQQSDIGADILFRQYEIAKNEGLLVTEDVYNSLPLDQQDTYVRLSNRNPISRHFGRQYINKSYLHYFEGSKGFNTRRLTRDVFGKQLGGILQNVLDIMLGAIKALRGEILVYHASSYINSALTSTLIYATHAQNPGMYGRDIVKSRSMIKNYRENLRNWNNLVVQEGMLPEGHPDKPKLLSGIKEAQQKVEQDPIHTAFSFGMSNTIRSDAYKTGSYDENVIFTKLKILFGSDDVAERAKTLLADPSTKWGKYIGEIYDSTELVPKVALYLRKMDEGLSPQQAVQTVLMAFPTYNNLNPFLNAIDQVSPYTKYMANYPKMMLYALDQKTIRTPAMGVASVFGPALTWDQEDKNEQWYQQHGFMKMPFDMAWYYESATPYALPSKSFTGTTMVDPTFLWQVISGGAYLPDLTPFTSLQK